MEKETIDKITSEYTQDAVTKKIERVAVYVRVSHQEQKLHGLSLDAQKMKLTEYAEKNKLRIVGWYIDEGVSGRKLIRKRPELQRMIQDAEKGLFDRIIFIKLDRFFRSVAEYHECMKRIAPVIWTATEESYDLSTANGRMLVNMKLTVAEMEADQGGERIDIVNEYKVQTGQPLTGSMKFGFKIVADGNTRHKKIIRDPEVEEIMYDLLDYVLKHQSKRKAVVYLYNKYHISMSYNSMSRLLADTMLYGAYRDNPAYCEAYIDKATYDKIQEVTTRNVKSNTAKDRDYIFAGIIKCPLCGNRLAGGIHRYKKPNGAVYYYKKYRCANCKINRRCDFNKLVSESVLERMLLENMEEYLQDAKVRSTQITDSNNPISSQYDIDAINEEIDRLNYSWQTGKIRKVEKYEKEFAELLEKLQAAEAEQKQVPVKDFSKIEAILHDGWKTIYTNLDDAHKRAFWRSFIRSIHLDWMGATKKITRVEFF